MTGLSRAGPGGCREVLNWSLGLNLALAELGGYQERLNPLKLQPRDKLGPAGSQDPAQLQPAKLRWLYPLL